MRLASFLIFLVGCVPSLENPSSGPEPGPDDPEEVSDDDDAPAETALHAIAVHEVCYEVPVSLDWAEGPVILALSAYNATTWSLDIADGVELESVILSGYEEQTLLGLPEGVPIEEHIGEAGDMSFFTYAESSPEYYESWPDSFDMDVEEDAAYREEFLQNLEAVAGMPPASVQTNYTARASALRDGGGFPTESEVHVVTAYEADTTQDVDCVGSRLGGIQVVLEPTELPAVLVLSSYEPVDWQVALEPGAELGGVLIAGYYGQTVQGVPEGTTVLHRGFTASFEEGPTRDWESDRIAELVGSAPVSWQVAYAASSFSVP